MVAERREMTRDGRAVRGGIGEAPCLRQNRPFPGGGTPAPTPAALCQDGVGKILCSLVENCPLTSRQRALLMTHGGFFPHLFPIREKPVRCRFRDV